MLDHLSEEELAALKEIMSDPLKRLSSLYKIVDKSGKIVTFKPNAIQKQFYENLWYCNIVLKARQLGISTFIGIYLLDKCLFKPNTSAGIICHTREDAEHFFKRVKFAYDNLPEFIKSERVATVDSARELVLSNGSSLRVGTSMRGSTLNYLHISEFGKIAAHYPEKAREIMTGSLNTLSAGQYVFIESTAEGREGPFYDLCKQAQALQDSKTPLTKLDYRFFFFPWYRDPSYTLDTPVTLSKEDQVYFAKLANLDIHLTDQQKWWYVKKAETQFDDMKREFPSTPDESFESALDGAYYSKQLAQARTEGRITKLYLEDTEPVHTAWDFGYADDTCIWLFQVDGKNINIIDFIEGSNEPLTYYLKLLKNKNYIWGKHLVPHDANVHDYSHGQTRAEVARKLGFSFTVIRNDNVQEGIDVVRALFPRLWFNESLTKAGISHLTAYKRTWNSAHGCWGSKPLHNEHSHAADAMRILACGMPSVNTREISDIDVERLRNIHQPIFTH